MTARKISRCISCAVVLAAISQFVQASDEPSVPQTQTGKERSLYIDVHELGPGGVTAEGVADAHEADLRVQDQYGVKFLRYWVDEQNGRVYCLSEAPNPNAVIATHRAAHGLIPTSVAEVTSGQ